MDSALLRILEGMASEGAIVVRSRDLQTFLYLASASVSMTLPLHRATFRRLVDLRLIASADLDPSNEEEEIYLLTAEGRRCVRNPTRVRDRRGIAVATAARLPAALSSVTM